MTESCKRNGRHVFSAGACDSEDVLGKGKGTHTHTHTHTHTTRLYEKLRVWCLTTSQYGKQKSFKRKKEKTGRETDFRFSFSMRAYRQQAQGKH